MNYDMSTWFFELYNLFKKLDRLDNEQSYRRIFDSMDDFVDLYEEGVSPREAYEDFWN